MLREIPKTRQHPGEPLRRWFFSHEQDLYVWQNEAKEIVAFQLCYAKHRNEHAIYWRADAGFSHLRVADGEQGLRSETPLLLADGNFEPEAVLTAFSALSAEIPANVVAFVRSRLAEYPASPHQDRASPVDPAESGIDADFL